MKKLILCTAIAATLSAGVSTSVNAALASDALLNFDSGVVTQNQYGQDIVLTGSYFAMGANFPGTRTAMVQTDGLFLGTSQPLSSLNGGTGIDDPWDFNSSLGAHFTVSATTVSNATATGADIDLSGWRVQWSNVPEINMGAAGTATVVCLDGGECAVGTRYTLDYATSVPADSAVFPNTPYWLHLEGTIGAASAVPVPAAVWLFGSGLLGLVGVARRRKTV